MTLPTSNATGSAGLYVRHEKAGLVLDLLPIPWNADAVIVEANVRLPKGAVTGKQDFTLSTAGDGPAANAELIAQPTKKTPLRVFFRIPVPCQSCLVQVARAGHSL